MLPLNPDIFLHQQFIQARSSWLRWAHLELFPRILCAILVSIGAYEVCLCLSWVRNYVQAKQVASDFDGPLGTEDE